MILILAAGMDQKSGHIVRKGLAFGRIVVEEPGQGSGLFVIISAREGETVFHWIQKFSDL